VLACYGINPKTVAKVRRRTAVHDAPMGPKEPPSGSYKEEEALIVAFRKHTLLPLDDCLYALQAAVPNLTRSSLHRCALRRLDYTAKTLQAKSASPSVPPPIRRIASALPQCRPFTEQSPF
jgi:hypothetical protein